MMLPSKGMLYISDSIVLNIHLRIKVVINDLFLLLRSEEKTQPATQLGQTQHGAGFQEWHPGEPDHCGRSPRQGVAGGTGEPSGPASGHPTGEGHHRPVLNVRGKCGL